MRKGSGGRCVPTMTERCSLWSALSAAACCFYRGSFMQVQVSEHKIFLRLFLPFVGVCTCVCVRVVGAPLTVGSSPVPAAGNVSLPAVSLAG